MIMTSVLERALGKERKYWSRRQRSEYIDGVLYGLTIASQILARIPKLKVPSWVIRYKTQPLGGQIK